MKILLIYRKRDISANSIESVFGFVFNSLDNRTKISQMSMKNGSNLFGIVFNLFSVLFKFYDIFHITGDVHYLAIVLPSKKTILTIHDSGFKKRNKFYSFFYKLLWFKLPLKRVSNITVPSYKVKDDLMQEYKINGNKIHVIPNPLKFKLFYRSNTFDIKCVKFLMVGFTENKNIIRQLIALNNININFELLLVGSIPKPILIFLQEQKMNYRNEINLTEHELLICYRNCDILLYASLFEGFGLPIIEAQSQGVVVITSNLPPMNFVGGDGAIFVDPQSIPSITKSIEFILYDEIERNNIINLGYDNAKKYSSGKFVDSFYELYTQFL